MFQVQKDADEEKELRAGVSVNKKSASNIQIETMEEPLSSENEASNMDIDDDENFTEFARRLDNMYKCSHDGKQNTAENTDETMKDSYEDDCDSRNDIKEMPPLPTNYTPWSMGESNTAAIHSQTPDAPRYDALNNPYIRIIHTNGIHHIGVVYCTCHRMDNTHADMMATSFVPTSFTRYRTFFTHAVLDDFHLSNLECKASAYQYFQKLRRQMSPMSPESVPNVTPLEMDEKAEMGRNGSSARFHD
jgi:hypothetical protein